MAGGTAHHEPPLRRVDDGRLDRLVGSICAERATVHDLSIGAIPDAQKASTSTIYPTLERRTT